MMCLMIMSVLNMCLMMMCDNVLFNNFQKMELLHVIIKSGPSPRPLAWSLEVSPSEDGDDWSMIRAFGDRDHCRKLWDLRPERRRRKARAAKRTSRADKPACSTQFASPRPLENGEVRIVPF